MNNASCGRLTAMFAPFLISLLVAPHAVWGEWRARLVADMKPGTAGENCQRFVSGGNLAYFISGNNMFQDYRLNRTDGTAAGTVEICPKGYYTGFPLDTTSGLATMGNRAVFARNNAGMLQLWQSDGTPAGTTALVDLGDPDDYVYSPGNFVSAGSQVFFTRGFGLLYRSNGTASGTLLLKDFYAELGVANPTSVSSEFTKGFCVRNGQLCFVVGDPADPQTAVWRSDGTPGGTQRVWQPGTDYNITGLWNTPDGLYAAATHDYIDMATPQSFHARELWRIVPESNSINRVYYQDDAVSHQGVTALVSLKGQVYFSIEETQKLWKTAGGAEAVVAAEVPTPTGLTYKPALWSLNATDRALVFLAQSAANSLELWTSDGTASGTRLLKDFTPGPFQTSDVTFLPFADGNLFVCSRDGSSSNYWLWKTDGTDAGTVQALQLPYAPGSTNVCEFSGGYLLLGSAPETGMEPYFLYEGTFAITQQPTSAGTAMLNSTVKFAIGVSEWARPWTQYQWMLNGVPITDAVESELVLPAVRHANTGLYTCRAVFNDGSADHTLVSDAARLTVVEKLPAMNAPMRVVLSLLLCLAAGMFLYRDVVRRNARVGERSGG